MPPHVVAGVQLRPQPKPG